MKFTNVVKTLKGWHYPIFSMEDLFLFFPEENREQVHVQLNDWKKKAWITPLKRGLYELNYPQPEVIPDLCIANKLYFPSYVSLETALSIYGLIPEFSAQVTSVTTKVTRVFSNRHGRFSFFSIHPRAFTGYRVNDYQGFEVRIAEPEKAFVDYVYFKVVHREQFNPEEERWDSAVLKGFNKKKILNYAELFHNKKLYGLIKGLKQDAYL